MILSDLAKIRTEMLLAAQLSGEDARSNEARQAWGAIVALTVTQNVPY